MAGKTMEWGSLVFLRWHATTVKSDVAEFYCKFQFSIKKTGLSDFLFILSLCLIEEFISNIHANIMLSL